MARIATRFNNTLRYFKIALFLIVPAVLILLPADYFDQRESICLSVRLLNMECPGCGITRACMHLIHLDFYEAWKFNKLSYLVMPLSSLLWLKYFLQQFGIRILKGF